MNTLYGFSELLCPAESPWGEIKTCREIFPGVFDIDTPGHGGYMLHPRQRHLVSPPAQALASDCRGYLCFEEDVRWAVLYLDVPALQPVIQGQRSCTQADLFDRAVRIHRVTAASYQALHLQYGAGLLLLSACELAPST